MSIQLQRKLVKILEEYTTKNSDPITRDDFVTYFIENRLNKKFLSKKEEFKRKVNHAIEDSINYGYITSTDTDTILSTTTKGRDFIKFPLGFGEEFLKRRKRTVIGVLLVIITTVLTIIFT